MSIEALWTAKFGTIVEPNTWKAGGVVVFETGRIFGGDSGSFYIGTYSVKDQVLTAKIAVTIYDPAYGSIFGVESKQNNIVAVGNIMDNTIEGEMAIDGQLALSVKFKLERRSDLP